MSRIAYESREGVAHVTWDDGKANSLSTHSLEEINAAIDRAEKDEASALVLFGRAGVFCAGFDLKELRLGGDATRELVRHGAELLVRLYELPIPVLAGCTGHSLGMGALLLLASDIRWGSPGPHKIALNETAIGLPLPTFATELAVAKLSRRHLTRAGMMAELYDPESAVDAGFLDRVCPEGALHDELSAEAARLGAQAGKHFAITKKRLHEETVDRIRASLASEF